MPCSILGVEKVVVAMVYLQVICSMVGFLSMLAMESVGLCGHDHTPTPSCTLSPDTLAAITAPVTVTCSSGLLTVLS